MGILLILKCSKIKFRKIQENYKKMPEKVMKKLTIPNVE